MTSNHKCFTVNQPKSKKENSGVFFPDVDCQPSQELLASTKESLMTRTSARKSRLTDNFFDAKERLEEKLAVGIKSNTIKTEMKIPKTIPPMEAANRGQTVIILSDVTIGMELGIEV